MTKTSRHLPVLRRPAALLAGAAAVLGLLTGCGSDSGSSSDSASTPRTRPGTPAPTDERPTSAATTAASSTPTPSRPGESASAAGTRCHTSELRASVGRNNPGAGQWNFPIVLTNRSTRTCTVRGYPGAAFLDASGGQLGPDPKRSEGTPTTVTLAPGGSAWAGLSFSNPEVSGARAATPAALLVTPPDERDPLKVTWTAGEVPVAGNASSVFLTVFAAGTGA